MRKTQNQMDKPKEKGCRNKRGKIGKKEIKPVHGRTEKAGGFSVKADQYVWK